jgi:hypothetical protein
MLRKIFSVTVSLSKNSLDYIKTNDIERLDELLSLEETNNKLSNLCERMLNTTILDLNNRYVYIIVWLLEGIADDYKELLNILKTRKKLNISAGSIHLYDKVNSLFESYQSLFYAFSLKSMAVFIKNQKHIARELMEFSCSEKDESAIISTLLAVAKKMGNFVGATLALKAQFGTNII